MKRIYLYALALNTLAVPASAAAAPRTFSELASLVVTILNTTTGLLVLGGIVVYFWGISTNILRLKDEGGKMLRNYFIWGIIALFVMVSIWGILQLLQNTLFGGDFYSPSTGTPAGTSQTPQFPTFNE